MLPGAIIERSRSIGVQRQHQKRQVFIRSRPKQG
jgi:hypothetical protein